MIISAEINQGWKLFKGGNYSEAETINFQKVLATEFIEGRKLLKRVNTRDNTVCTPYLVKCCMDVIRQLNFDTVFNTY